VSDRWAVALAVSTALGAVAARRLPLWVGVMLVVAALGARRPAVLCVGAAVLASALGARSNAGLQAPAPATPVHGRATLLTDPVDLGGAVRVELRLGPRRVEAWARGAPAPALRELLAGETVEVAGRLSPVPARARAHLVRRHIAARLTVTSAGNETSGGPLARLANDVRRTLLRGTSSFPDDQRALFTGFVLGDDRDQDPVSVDDFRAAGLTHLLAVSGQNVAFILALAAPVLRLLGLRGRFFAGVAILVGFGVLTRWEPSVLRASAMAGVTLLAATLGRPASTLRVLALASAALLLVDPLLVRSVGFLLSCGACAGIAVLAGPLSRRMPLPLAVTLAAQVGVAPVLVPVFGGVPVASVPANLLAVPAAAPVMVWGLVAGLPAGLVGEPIAGLVHLPNRLLVSWIAGVARWGAALPFGQLGASHVVVLCGLAAAGAALPRTRRAAVALAVVVCLWPTVGPVHPEDGRPLAGDGRLWRRGAATVLVVGRPRPGPLLGALRVAGVRELAVVALTSPNPSAKADLDAVLARHPARLVLTAADAVPGAVVAVGGLRVVVRSNDPRLVVDVRHCRRPCGPGPEP